MGEHKRRAALLDDVVQAMAKAVLHEERESWDKSIVHDDLDSED